MRYLLDVNQSLCFSTAGRQKEHHPFMELHLSKRWIGGLAAWQALSIKATVVVVIFEIESFTHPLPRLVDA
jgi:hypothetical protein